MAKLKFSAALVISFIIGLVYVNGLNQSLAGSEPVRLGIDNIGKYQAIFAGKRVGLITNATGLNSNFETSIDVLKEKTNLTALFSPEHGLRGVISAGDKVGGQTLANLPVYSLYGDTKKPTAKMLENVDILAFDIQDIGCRSYTYIYTMAYAMQSAREHGKTFVVFDRPNPVGGINVEGGTVEKGYESFIGMYPIAYRHGMTVGELARLFNTEFGINCDLKIIPMTGWRREMYFDETNLPWVMTSPNIPTPDTALTYAATGILGGTNISEGVGTTRPFDFVGAPGLNARALADRLNAEKLPGVVFRAAEFTPLFGNFAGKACSGAQLHIVDRKAFKPVRTSLTLVYIIDEITGGRLYFKPGGARPTIDLVTGGNDVRFKRYTLEALIKKWDNEAEKFKEMSKKYYIYD